MAIDFACFYDYYYDGEVGNFVHLLTHEQLPEYDTYWISWWIGMSTFVLRAGFDYYFGHLKKKKLFDPINQHIIDTNKFQQLLFFNFHNIGTPSSLFFFIKKRHFSLYADLIKKRFSYPFIAKDPYLDRGKGLFLISNDQELEDCLSTSINTWLLFQEYISNEGEYRITVLGDKIIGTFKRYNPTSYRNNLAKWTIFENCTLPEAIQQDMIAMVQLYGLDFAGIDLIISGDKSYVLEINASPQFARTESVCGINVVQEVVEYLKNKE